MLDFPIYESQITRTSEVDPLPIVCSATYDGLLTLPNYPAPTLRTVLPHLRLRDLDARIGLIAPLYCREVTDLRCDPEKQINQDAPTQFKTYFDGVDSLIERQIGLRRGLFLDLACVNANSSSSDICLKIIAGDQKAADLSQSLESVFLRQGYSVNIGSTDHGGFLVSNVKRARPSIVPIQIDLSERALMDLVVVDKHHHFTRLLTAFRELAFISTGYLK